MFLKNVEIPDSKTQKNIETYVSPEMSKIRFPGLGTLRLAIWATYVCIFAYMFGYLSTNLFDQFLVIVSPNYGKNISNGTLTYVSVHLILRGFL